MKIKAQDMYDIREASGICSGTDLHDLFREVLGEPSPSGKKVVDLPADHWFLRLATDAGEDEVNQYLGEPLCEQGREVARRFRQAKSSISTALTE